MKKRILELSYKNKLSHIGSALSAVDIIDVIYDLKTKKDKFVLSAGHCFLAQLVVMEKHGLTIPKDITTHPESYIKGVDVPTGSLGQGLPIAVGMALARKQGNIYCMISDGEMSEGSIWEALRIAGEQNVTNLKLVVNANGWAAYKRVMPDPLIERLRAFGWAVIPVDGHKKKKINGALLVNHLNTPIAVFARTNWDLLDPYLREPQEAHYKILNKEEYEKIIR